MITTKEMIVNCDACGRSHFRNEIKKEDVGAVEYRLGPRCHGELMERLKSKWFVGCLIKNTLSVGERDRLRKERAKSYARKEVAA